MGINLVTITQDQVTPKVLALFGITKPTMPRAFNVLEGVNRCEILVDDLARQNTASVSLAKKLGYQREPEYRYVWWTKK